MKQYMSFLITILLLAISAESGAQNTSVEEQSPSSSCIDEYFTKLEFGGMLVPLEPSGNWELAMEPSMVSDKITFFACLPSRPTAEAQPSSKSPSLFLICGIDVMNAAAIVVADYRVRNNVRVATRFDDDVEMETSDWKLSLRRKAIVAPETSGEFAKKLMMRNQLSVQLTLRNQDVLEFTYDLQGTSDSLDVLGQGCRWD